MKSRVDHDLLGQGMRLPVGDANHTGGDCGRGGIDSENEHGFSEYPHVTAGLPRHRQSCTECWTRFNSTDLSSVSRSRRMRTDT